MSLADAWGRALGQGAGAGTPEMFVRSQVKSRQLGRCLDWGWWGAHLGVNSIKGI